MTSVRHLTSLALLLAAALAATFTVLTVGADAGPTARAAKACSSYSNQAAAQRAKDTRDGDGDGVYCESLPCPCAKPGGSSGGTRHQRGGGTRKKASRHRAHTIRGRVSAVTDGDTIKVRAGGTLYKVRLIGIDTPETKRPGTPIECGGPQASAYMKRIARRGRRVTLRTDPTQDTRDRYGRLLAYASTSSGSLQKRMLAKGLAKVYVYRGSHFQRYHSFRAASNRAKRADRASWRRCGGDFHKAR